MSISQFIYFCRVKILQRLDFINQNPIYYTGERTAHLKEIGKKISSHHLITSSSNQLDISHLSAGIYLVRIHTENGAVMRKMIKQ